MLFRSVPSHDREKRKKREKEEEKQKKIREKEEEKERKLKEKENKKKKPEEEVKIDVEYFENTIVNNYSSDDEYWKKGKKRTVNGQKVFIHEESNLILTIEDGNASLYGLLVNKTHILLSKDIKDEIIKEWASDNGINVDV